MAQAFAAKPGGWLDIHQHVFWGLIVLGFALGMYVLAHVGLRSQYLQSPAVESAIHNAVQLYQVRENPENHQLGLYVEGHEFQLGGQFAGPLGLGRLVSARGYLANVSSKVQSYNNALESFLNGSLMALKPVLAQPGVYQMPLSRFSFGKAGGVDGQMLQVDFGSAEVFRSLQANEAGARRLAFVLANAVIVNQRELTYSEAANRVWNSADELSLSAGQRAAREQILQRSRELTPKLKSAETEIKNFDASQFFCEDLKRLREPLRAYMPRLPACGLEEFAPPQSEASGRKSTCPAATKLRDACNRPLDLPMHQALARMVKDELGFFWVFGSWLWIEILLLVMFGVMVEWATRTGLEYTQRNADGATWDPRETGRSLLKLVYAPPLAMVVIWTMMITDLIQTDAPLSDSGMTGFVPVAFILGLFPNLGYSVLERLAQAIFKSTSMAKGRQRAAPVRYVQVGTPPVAVGEAPNLNVLKARIKRHTTAIMTGPEDGK